MAANNKIYEKVIYPDADHAFHNDTGGRYHPEAARDAWERMLAWFEQYVRSAWACNFYFLLSYKWV